jgi:hypothetical protein
LAQYFFIKVRCRSIIRPVPPLLWIRILFNLLKNKKPLPESQEEGKIKGKRPFTLLISQAKSRLLELAQFSGKSESAAEVSKGQIPPPLVIRSFIFSM